MNFYQNHCDVGPKPAPPKLPPDGLLIYLIRLKGKPVYVGQIYGENQTVAGRWNDHCYNAHLGHKLKLQRAIRKYGPEAFTIEVIARAADRVELNLKEQILIRAYDTLRQGFNVHGGGSASFRIGS